MIKLEDVEFPSKYLNCYESVLITNLKCLGLSENAIAMLMGTQVGFVLKEDIRCIAPRFTLIDDEWERVHDLRVETLLIDDEADLRDGIVTKLESGTPVSLSTDIYYLPHTPHYNQLHLYHYVNIFGYDDSRYYMICPFYRYRGWIDRDLIHAGFFASPALHEYFPFLSTWDLEMRMPLDYGLLVSVPELELKALSSEDARSLVEQSCQYMVGLAAPEALADIDPRYFGLAGIRTLSHIARGLTSEQGLGLGRDMLLNLSRQFMWVAFSRYWLCELLRTYQDDLLPADKRDDCWEQFEIVIQTWRVIGARLGSDVHTGDQGAVERVAIGLEKAYRRETVLFIKLLEALPGVERKVEILESLNEAYPVASFDEDESRLSKQFVAPRTSTEEALAQIWSQVLEIEQVGVYDNFFDLGGDSLLAARVHNRLQEDLKTDVSILDLFKNPTLNALASFLTQTQGRTHAREHTQERGQKYRAALAQQKHRLSKPK